MSQQNHGLIVSGSGAPPAPGVNMTCAAFYESVISAIEMLNAGSSHGDNRFVLTCCCFCCCALYPVYTIEQISSRHQANIKQLKHTSCTCILNAFAGCLFDNCSMFAWSCKLAIRLKASTERSSWTELNWRGLVFDEVTNGQAWRARWSLVDAYVSVAT